MITAQIQFIINSNNYKAAKQFYERLFTLNFEWQDEKLEYSDFSAGGIKLVLINNLKPGSVNPQIKSSQQSLSFLVDSLEKTCQGIAYLQEMFISKVRVINHGFCKVRSLVLQDPDNNKIEIFDYKGV